MPQFIATVDTSVLVSLQSAELLGAVSVLFNRLLVPAGVRKELEDGGESNRSALRAIDEFAIFEPCNDYEPSLVKWLLDTRENLKEGRDQGEAEAVIQAAKRSASMILIDDPLGREWAKKHAIEFHGSIWICRQLRYTGYLSELRLYYARMIKGGRRQPLREMNSYLEEFGEPSITPEEYRAYGLGSQGGGPILRE
jgi:predicted nucleic acid-binding protein